MNFMFDLEFTGLHQTTSPISIGVVNETGAGFYGEFTDYAKHAVDDWLQTHVINKLGKPATNATYVKGTRYQVAKALETWLLEQGCYKADPAIFWGDCCAYDWVLLCELFGGALHLPEHIHYIPRDICTLMAIAGVDPDISRTAYALARDVPADTYRKVSHNALGDAYLIRACYLRLAAHLES